MAISGGLTVLIISTVIYCTQVGSTKNVVINNPRTIIGKNSVTVDAQLSFSGLLCLCLRSFFKDLAKALHSNL